MDTILTTFLTIFVMIFLGYVLKTTKIVNEDIVPSINSIVSKIFLPCLIFQALYNADLSRFGEFTLMPLIIIFSSIIICVISFFVLNSLNLSKKEIWSIIIPLMICNTGFMGYPIILGIFGNSGFLRAIFCDISASILFIICSIILIIIYGGSFKKAFNEIVFFFPLWAIFFGILFNFCNIQIGSFLTNLISYLAQGTIPLIMISLGISINFNGIKNNPIIVVFSSIVKLIIFPLITLFFVLFFGFSGLEFKICIIQSAMPSALTSLIVATDFDLDYKLTSDIIFVNTFLSLITLPIIMYLL